MCAGRRCKEIIDGNRDVLARTLKDLFKDERALLVLQTSDAHQVIDGLSIDLCDKYFQRLADIDIASMHGGFIPDGGLLGIVWELYKLGIYDDDVWKVLPKPTRVDL